MYKHGHASRKGAALTYRRWKDMKMRPKRQPQYRDITVCERWASSFPNFLADMGECPDGYSLERKDGKGNYEPDNCCWIPRREQARNTTRTVRITHAGKTQILSDWAREYDIRPNLLSKRLKLGWPMDKCLIGAREWERIAQTPQLD